jgi:hypothetical protein
VRVAQLRRQHRQPTITAENEVCAAVPRASTSQR